MPRESNAEGKEKTVHKEKSVHGTAFDTALGSVQAPLQWLRHDVAFALLLLLFRIAGGF